MPAAPLTTWIEQLAAGIVEAQEQLDAHVDASLVDVREHLHELPPLLLDALLPPVLRLDQTTIEVEFELDRTTERERSGLRGRPRTAFSRARFPTGASNEALCICFDVRAIPVRGGAA
jgi:hypothetical protein